MNDADSNISFDENQVAHSPWGLDSAYIRMLVLVGLLFCSRIFLQFSFLQMLSSYVDKKKEQSRSLVDRLTNAHLCINVQKSYSMFLFETLLILNADLSYTYFLKKNSAEIKLN